MDIAVLAVMTDGRRSDAVLWATNDETEFDVLRRALDNTGCVVDRVRQDVALTTLAAREYQLILVSLDPPAEDGLALVRAIRVHPDYSAIPVVVVTRGNIPADTLARAFIEGAHDHIDETLREKSVEARIATARQWRAMVLRIRDRAARVHTDSEPPASRAQQVDARIAQRASLPIVPQSYGALHVSGDVLPASDVRDDLFDIVVDGDGRMSVFALSSGGQGAAALSLVMGAQQVVRAHAGAGDSIETIASELHAFVATQDSPHIVSMALLRFTRDASSVEIMNAGYPPILASGPGARTVSFPSRSKPFGLLEDARHPFELVSVARGTSFAIASDGLASAQESRSLMQLESSLHGQDGFALASGRSAEIRALITQILGVAENAVRDDATLVVVAVDPNFAPSFPSPPSKRRSSGF